MVGHDLFPKHKHGCRKQEFENFSKKGCFLSFEWQKTNFSTLSPLEKLLENPLVALPGKNPSDAHTHKHVKVHHFCKKLCLFRHLATLFNNTTLFNNAKQGIAG